MSTTSRRIPNVQDRKATAVDYTTAGESIIGVTNTSVPRTITLSDADRIAGKQILIKDESGGATANNIFIEPESGDLDGDASASIIEDFGSLAVYSDGTNWFVGSKAVAGGASASSFSPPVEAVLPSTFLISSSSPLNTGLQITFVTTADNQKIMISTILPCQTAVTGAGNNAAFGYKLDGGSLVKLNVEGFNDSDFVTFYGTFQVTPTLAGSHTVVIWASRGAGNINLFGTASGQPPARINAFAASNSVSGIGTQGMLFGDVSGTTPGAGLVGEMISNTGNASCGTGSQTEVLSITLTPGTWAVSGALNNDNNVNTTGFDGYLYIKGVNTNTYAYDRSFNRGFYSGGAGVAQYTGFSSRTVTISPSDTDKTIKIKAQAIGATSTMYGHLTAVRTAPLGGAVSYVPTTSFTPTCSFGVNCTMAGFYSIVNGIMTLSVSGTGTGAVTAGNLSINVPSGYTIDTSKMLTIDLAWVGCLNMYYLDAGVVNYIAIRANAISTTALNFHYSSTGESLTAQISNTAPFTFGNTDKFQFIMQFPVLAA